MAMPEKLVQIKLDDVMKWCEEHDELDWLEKEASKVVVKDGVEKPITYIELRKAWAQKFMPELLKKKSKKKAPTMLEKIRKYKAKH